MPVLSDVLKSGLAVIFCGTAVGETSAAVGAYYAGRGNSFWRTLHATGLTPIQLKPAEFRRVLEWNIGLTDLAKNASGSDRNIGSDDFNPNQLTYIILSFSPRIIAFTSKKAAETFLDRSVHYGLLPDSIAGTRLYVLPSTSGAARRWWDEKHWYALAKEVRTLGA